MTPEETEFDRGYWISNEATYLSALLRTLRHAIRHASRPGLNLLHRRYIRRIGLAG